jgi:hypothetical protein
MPKTTKKQMKAFVQMLRSDPKMLRMQMRSCETHIESINWSLNYHLEHDHNASLQSEYALSLLRTRGYQEEQLAQHRANLALVQ